MAGNAPPAQQQQQQQQAGQQGVQVIVRVRPMLPREVNQDNAVEVLSPQELVVFRTGSEFASVYDHVLGPESAQQDLYQSIQSGVLSALQGYNCSVMAYGQTGTGKTHSMLGPPGVQVSSLAEAAEAAGTGAAPPAEWAQLGLMPRAITDLFQLLRQREAQEGIRISVAASYLEIYNDRIYDLLQPYYKGKKNKWDQGDLRKARSTLDVREDKNGITYVPHALLAQVNSLSAVVALLNKGAKNRAVRHTEMNMQSSRSHAILQLVIEQYSPGATDALSKTTGGRTATRGGGTTGATGVLRSKVNFVDLAGSERWNKGVDMDADRVGEMTAINTSLTALASVVAALTCHDKGRRAHVPYRDSKLTHLLQDSLGGNCRTFIIAAVSPAISSFEETVSTLKFADRARAIRNNPVVNMSRDLGSVLALKEREIQRLRGLLAMYMSSPNPAPSATGASALVTGTGASASITGADTATGAGAGAVSGAGVGVGAGATSGSYTYDSAAVAAAGAQDLVAELENTRRALLMERQLREDLQAQLMRAGTADDGRMGLVSPGLMSPVMPSPARVWDSSSGAVSGTPVVQQQQQGLGTPTAAAQFDYLRVTTPDKSDSESCLSPGSQAAQQHQHPFRTVMARRAELGLVSPGRQAKGRSYASTYAMRRSHSSGLISSAQGQLMSGGRSGIPNSPGHRVLPGSPVRHSMMGGLLGPAGSKVGSPLAPTSHSHLSPPGRRSILGHYNHENATEPTTNPPLNVDSSPTTHRAAALQQHVRDLQSIYGPHGSPSTHAVRRSAPNITDTHTADDAGTPASAPVSDMTSPSLTPPNITPRSEPPSQLAQEMGYAGSSPGGRGGWGRHAIMSSQVTAAPQAIATTDVTSTSASGLSTGIASLGGGGAKWGRAALLGNAAQGRAGPGQTDADVRHGDGGASQAVVQGSGRAGTAEGRSKQSSAASGEQQRSSSARRPGRLDKGSMIFIMGSSTSSIKAKQMAAALSDTPWG